MLKQAISDSSGTTVAVDTADGQDVGLVVATRPLKIYKARMMFFSDEFGDIEMAHDAAFGATPEKVHDGIDNVYWTGTVIKGTWTLNDTGSITDHTPADAGDHCIKGVGTGKNGAILLTHPTSIDLTMYAAITGWIYVIGWDVGGNLELQARFAGGNVGNLANINIYFSEGLQGSWQQFIIPLDDLALNGLTIDSLLIRNSDDPNQFYLDDIQIEETGTVFRMYQLKPDPGTNLYVQKILTTYVAAYDTDHADASTLFMAYDATLGITLTNGWLFERVEDGKVTDSQIVKSLHEMAYTGSKLSDVLCDGVNTMLTVEYIYPVPEILKAENLESLKVQMQDPNMGDFISMRMAAIGYQEQIN